MALPCYDNIFERLIYIRFHDISERLEIFPRNRCSFVCRTSTTISLRVLPNVIARPAKVEVVLWLMCLRDSCLRRRCFPNLITDQWTDMMFTWKLLWNDGFSSSDPRGNRKQSNALPLDLRGWSERCPVITMSAKSMKWISNKSILLRARKLASVSGKMVYAVISSITIMAMIEDWYECSQSDWWSKWSQNSICVDTVTVFRVCITTYISYIYI